LEFHHSVTGFLNFHNLCGQLAVTKDDLIADLHLSARLTQAFPALIAQVSQQQHFHGAAGRPVTQ
jgi:hypothetical protein